MPRQTLKRALALFQRNDTIYVSSIFHMLNNVNENYKDIAIYLQNSYFRSVIKRASARAWCKKAKIDYKFILEQQT